MRKGLPQAHERCFVSGRSHWGLSVRGNKRDGQLKLIPAKAIDRAAIGVYDINHKSSA